MILIGLGANLPSDYGTPAETLEEAKKELERKDIKIVNASQTYLSAPVPLSDTPWYANAVLSVETALASLDLLDTLSDIETAFGRVRSYRNAPRVLDLDIIAYHNEIQEENRLTLPHPRMQNRAFVLKPLQEIAPKWEHPLLKASVAALIAQGKKKASDVFEQTIPLTQGDPYRVAG